MNTETRARLPCVFKGGRAGGPHVTGCSAVQVRENRTAFLIAAPQVGSFLALQFLLVLVLLVVLLGVMLLPSLKAYGVR